MAAHCWRKQRTRLDALSCPTLLSLPCCWQRLRSFHWLVAGPIPNLSKPWSRRPKPEEIDAIKQKLLAFPKNLNNTPNQQLSCCLPQPCPSPRGVVKLFLSKESFHGALASCPPPHAGGWALSVFILAHSIGSFLSLHSCLRLTDHRPGWSRPLGVLRKIYKVIAKNIWNMETQIYGVFSCKRLIRSEGTS